MRSEGISDLILSLHPDVAVTAQGEVGDREKTDDDVRLAGPQSLFEQIERVLSP